jgi:hypothetical protein
MAKIFETLLAFFQEDSLNRWQIVQDNKRNLLSLSCESNDIPWNCYAQALEEEQQFAFYSVLSTQIPSDKLQLVAEYLTRANYGLIIGNFEMDYFDGEVRYKTSIDVEGDRLSSALIRQIVYSNLFRTNQYLPGIIDILQSDIAPVEAILRIESK